MAVFTQASLSFSATLDSKGRITIPARIRKRLGLDKEDEVALRLQSSQVVRKRFSSNQEALDFISGLEDVESFSFDGDILEVVLDE